MKGRIRLQVMAAVLICIMLCGLGWTGEARADLIWEPENSFYQKNSDECNYIDREYIVNSPNGYAYAYVSPEDDTIQNFIPNGTECYIAYVYGEGDNQWGLYSQSLNSHGWVRLSEFYLKYDYKSFYAEYKDSITKPEIDDISFEPSAKSLVWAYPGSAESYEWGNRKMGDSTAVTLEHIFVDEDGRKWGFISYFCGHVDAWMCISDSENKDMPVREIELPTLYKAVTEEPPRPEKGEFPLLPVLLVAGVVLISGILLVVLVGRRKHDVKK